MNDPGGRGDGWVLGQFALMAVILVVGLLAPDWPGRMPSAVGTVGIVLAALGVGLALVSGRALGRALTPFPRPAAGGSLVERGPYGVVRHPVYTGGILLMVGFALWASPWALLPTAALAVLWALKARVEERHLLARFEEYDAYSRRVRWRLVPFVY